MRQRMLGSSVSDVGSGTSGTTTPHPPAQVWIPNYGSLLLPGLVTGLPHAIQDSSMILLQRMARRGTPLIKTFVTPSALNSIAL